MKVKDLPKHINQKCVETYSSDIAWLNNWGDWEVEEVIKVFSDSWSEQDGQISNILKSHLDSKESLRRSMNMNCPQ